MEKINILLVCNAGMSTSLLIEKIEEAASNNGIEAKVSAHPVEDVKNHLNNQDIILLGPQVRFKQKSIQTLVDGKIPVEVIDMAAYGTMNGAKVLNQAISLVQEE
jgi:cellobiose PTS system EIIB component